MDVWQVALFLAVLNERIIEYFAVPLVEKFGGEEMRWMIMYVSAVTGGVMSFLSGLDLFAQVGVTFPEPVGLLLTALVVGGGSNFVSAVLDAVKGVRDALESRARLGR